MHTSYLHGDRGKQYQIILVVCLANITKLKGRGNHEAVI